MAIYERELGDGTLEITDSELHKVTLIVSDIKGNSSELNFYVKKDNTNLCNQNNKSFKKPNSIQSIASLDSNVVIFMDSNTLYDQNQEINIDIATKKPNDIDDLVRISARSGLLMPGAREARRTTCSMAVPNASKDTNPLPGLPTF